jgi:hypothetical protein
MTATVERYPGSRYNEGLSWGWFKTEMALRLRTAVEVIISGVNCFDSEAPKRTDERATVRRYFRNPGMSHQEVLDFALTQPKAFLACIGATGEDTTVQVSTVLMQHIRRASDPKAKIKELDSSFKGI